MKLKYLLLSVPMLGMVSCRNGDDSPQQIDQIANIYIDSAGVDMLNTKLAGTYTTVAMKDLGGIYDRVPISGFSVRKDSDTLNFIEYLSGAARNPVDSLSTEAVKVYRSDILLQLTKTVNKVNKTTTDKMNIFYTSTPEVFGISKIYYNKKLVFTKTAGQPNTVKIHK